MTGHENDNSMCQICEIVSGMYVCTPEVLCCYVAFQNSRVMWNGTLTKVPQYNSEKTRRPARFGHCGC